MSTKVRTTMHDLVRQSIAIAIGQILKDTGFTGTQGECIQVLISVCERYLEKIGKEASELAQLNERSIGNAIDIFCLLSLKQMSQLHQYVEWASQYPRQPIPSVTADKDQLLNELPSEEREKFQESIQVPVLTAETVKDVYHVPIPFEQSNVNLPSFQSHSESEMDSNSLTNVFQEAKASCATNGWISLGRQMMDTMQSKDRLKHASSLSFLTMVCELNKGQHIERKKPVQKPNVIRLKPSA